MLFIEALTSGEVLRISVELVKELLEEETEFIWIYNYMLRGALQDIWELKTMLHKCSAQERYQWFLKTIRVSSTRLPINISPLFCG